MDIEYQPGSLKNRPTLIPVVSFTGKMISVDRIRVFVTKEIKNG